MELVCKIDEAITKLLKLDRDKLYDIKINEHRNKRSLNANAYSWVLMEKLAKALHSDKDKIYIQMLQRYGVFTHMIVKPNVADRIVEEWRYAEKLGNVKANGTEGVQLLCYFGSSNYDSKEMSRFIDGIVSECKELEIETMTPEQLDILKEEWEK